MQRMTLWDKQFRLVWDSETAVTPAYQAITQCITGWVHATIDFTDGFRWTGQLFRCPEGVKRFSRADLTYVTWPVNPMLEGKGHV